MAHRNQNDELTDQQLLHGILVLAFAERLGRRMVELLNDTEPQIASLVRNTRTGLLNAIDFRRMNKLLSDVRKVRSRAWRAIEREAFAELKKLAQEQPDKMLDIVREVEGRTRGIGSPSESLLNTIVDKRAFEGRTLKQWLDKQKEDDDARISNQVRFGMISRETPDRIVRRVFGEARVLGANGATEEARRRLFEIIVLATLFTSGEAKREFTVLNPDVFNRELYLAILDDRTTPICRSLNRRVFRVGEGPYPPIHFWCRSLRIFLMPGAAPAAITDLAAWLATQSAETRRLVDEARAARFARP